MSGSNLSGARSGSSRLQSASERGHVMRPGGWLGIDVGSSKAKVLALCLVTSDAQGRARVSFERGCARADADIDVWPENKALTFIDLESPRWIARTGETGIRGILERSVVVAAWVALARDRTLVAGAAIDAPCGFAGAGHAKRETELHAASAFDTSDAARFDADLRRFAANANETPLQQRFFWKLVGHTAYRSLIAMLGRGPHDARLEAVTSFCAERLELGRDDGTLPAPPAGCVTLREAFPSDTYARANGARGVLRADARAVLRALVEAPWEFCGASSGRTSSVPTRQMQARLLAHQSALRAELDGDAETAVALESMRKIPKDPSWADLWDAFACAFAVACEAHGAAVHVGVDKQRLLAEGAIVAPASQPTT